MVSGRIRIRGFLGVYVSFKSRVADPGRFYPDPTFKKKHDPDLILEKKLVPGPAQFSPNRIHIYIFFRHKSNND